MNRYNIWGLDIQCEIWYNVPADLFETRRNAPFHQGQDHNTTPSRRCQPFFEKIFLFLKSTIQQILKSYEPFTGRKDTKMNQEQILNRINQMIFAFDINTTAFCRKMQISTTQYYKAKKGTYYMTDRTLDKLDRYAASYGF